MDRTMYVTLARWPQGLDERGQVELLIAATGLDPFMARQRVAHGIPGVLLRIDEVAGRDMIERLEQAGAMAIGLSPAQVAAAPEPHKAKRLVEAQGAPEPMYMVEPWHGEHEGLLCKDVFLLVRGKIDRSRVRVNTAFVDGAGGALSTSMSTGALGGAMPLGMTGSHPTRSTTIKFTYIIDLYTRSGRRVRIDADKFNFDVLGDEKGLTNLDNIDKLALRLATQCKGAMVDTGFAHFRVAPELDRHVARDLAGTAITKRDEGPAFELYSVWSWCLYRRLMTSP